jgi:uncharacterized protein (DUF1697 family)
MTRYAVLLRGINVGGVTLKMADVVAALTAAGFTNVSTVLASGNVRLTSDQDSGTVRATAEQALRDTFGYDAWVLVYGLDSGPGSVRAIDDAYPFPREVDGVHSYVTFVSDPDVQAELIALPAAEHEQIAGGPGVVYWQVPMGATLDSVIGKTMGKKRYASTTTTRNLRTVEKLLR